MQASDVWSDGIYSLSRLGIAADLGGHVGGELGEGLLEGEALEGGDARGGGGDRLKQAEVDGDVARHVGVPHLHHHLPRLAPQLQHRPVHLRAHNPLSLQLAQQLHAPSCAKPTPSGSHKIACACVRKAHTLSRHLARQNACNTALLPCSCTIPGTANCMHLCAQRP